MISDICSKINLLQRIFCFKACLASSGFLANVVCHMRADFPFQTFGWGLVIMKDLSSTSPVNRRGWL